ncbi:unnamed protein product [Phytophthora lilii]|uniref:RxLR effector protein n=1 Tax=Phytophthora lilii TaxID=2077276 RepID=A0A9W6U370_9STRA|nr:unnamed protein product [Phytophthora lilii]
MHLHYILLVALATLVGSSNFASADLQQAPFTKRVFALDDGVASTQQGDVAKRSLRIHEATDNSDDVFIKESEDEERGVFTTLRLKYWLAQGIDPLEVYKKLGLKGLGQEAWKNKNYPKYIAYSKKWWNNQ